MNSADAELLVVPQDLEWPVVGRTRNGALLVRRAAVSSIEELNGLPRGSLGRARFARLLAMWYRERRKLGYPPLPELERYSATLRIA